MKKITILGILALVIMPIFSDAMEQKRKPEFQKGNRKVTKKRKIGEDSSAQNACGWDDCPEEIKMHILYFVIDANGAMNAIATKDKKAIFKFIKQWRSLLSVNKEFNSFALDKQVLKIGEINVALLEKYPVCFLELVEKSLKSKCGYFFKLPSFIVIPPNEGSVFVILAIASRDGRAEFCQNLINAGISDYVAENTPLIHAIYLRNQYAVKKLIECGKSRARLKNSMPELGIASMVGDSAIVKMLLDAIPNSADGSYYNASFMKAAGCGNKEIGALLLDRGASVDSRLNNGVSALILAASYGHNELVELLIDKGAELNKQSNDCRSALIVAASNGHQEVVRLLLDRGADVNQVDHLGNIALIFAAYHGHREVVQLLLDHHADVNKQNQSGKTALSAATLAGHQEIVDLLMAYGAKS